LKRHCRELPAEHATEIADIVADLIVNFIKARSGHNTSDQPQARLETTQTGCAREPVGSAAHARGRPR
jgi:serine kinase of HPr protein (carbohydrate metabolism regulator)